MYTGRVRIRINVESALARMFINHNATAPRPPGNFMNRRTCWRHVVWIIASLPLVTMAVPDANNEFLAAERLKPDVAHGADLFETCAACHGPDGGGASDGSVPAIAGQHFRVLVKQLVDFRHDRRWDIRMEHFTDRHRLAGPQELTDLAAYIESLPRTGNKGYGDGENVAHGARVYFNLCASCHGPTGAGDAASLVPRLAGQHFAYLERQMYDAVDGRRPNMGGDHARRLSRLDREDILGVADYLSRLLPQAQQQNGPGRP
jgi:cytochrome c553